MDFQPFHKIARFSREVLVTEKIDGTNAQIAIWETPTDGPYFMPEGCEVVGALPYGGKYWSIAAGSRNRWLKPGKEHDNFSFAGWVAENAGELVRLGPGRHFGEWWGQGIQRNYGLKEKRFSLFNVSRWAEADDLPSCCFVVPVLAKGPMDGVTVELAMQMLRTTGSYAAPGFMSPEGIVIYHYASRTLFKKTLEKDDEPKSKAA